MKKSRKDDEWVEITNFLFHRIKERSEEEWDEVKQINNEIQLRNWYHKQLQKTITFLEKETDLMLHTLPDVRQAVVTRHVDHESEHVNVEYISSFNLNAI